MKTQETGDMFNFRQVPNVTIASSFRNALSSFHLECENFPFKVGFC